MCIPWGRASTLPCGCTIVSWLLLLCLCILSLPWLTFEFALWNSGKVKEAEAYFLQTRNVKHRKTSMPRILTASCEVSVTNCYLYVKDLYLFTLFDVAGIAKRLSIVKNLLFLVSHSVMSNSLWPPRLQQARLPCPSPSHRTCSNSCPLSRWCHPTISSSIVHFSSFLPSFPASGSFPMSQFFTSGAQSIGASAHEVFLNSPGLLQSMGSQRVEHNWVTEQDNIT